MLFLPTVLQNGPIFLLQEHLEVARQAVERAVFFQNLEEEEADFKEGYCLELLVLLAGKSFLTLRVEE